MLKKEQTIIISSTGYDNLPLLLYTTVVYSVHHLGEKIGFVDRSGAKNLSQFLLNTHCFDSHATQ